MSTHSRPRNRRLSRPPREQENILNLEIHVFKVYSNCLVYPWSNPFFFFFCFDSEVVLVEPNDSSLGYVLLKKFFYFVVEYITNLFVYNF